MRYSTFYGSYEIDTMPGQPQMALCHSFSVFPACRKKGFGHKLKQHQEMVLKNLGYNAAMCTVRMDNMAQIKILERAGWQQSFCFDSSYTGILTFCFMKAIK